MVVNNWFFLILAVFLCVLVMTGVIIPQILLIAFRKKLFDETDSRKIHKGHVPRLGGIAFFPSILFSVLLGVGVSSIAEDIPTLQLFSEHMRTFCFITCGLVILYLTGMADDLIGVRYRAKFIFQLFAALLMIAGGIWLDNLHGLFYINMLPLGMAIALTLAVSIFIINAINLIDGIDGLASGLSGVAAAFYGIAFFMTGHYFYSLIAFATLGALISFFFYNVAGNPDKHRKIFMGDTGTLTIGFILSVFGCRICMFESMEYDINPGVVAFAPLLIPGFDVIRVYFRRVRRHRNPFLPDKTHIHHKLLALGLKQKIVMPLIILASVCLTLLSLWLAGFMNITFILLIDMALWILGNMFLTSLIRKRELRLQTKLYD